jgi:hypothetical protein
MLVCSLAVDAASAVEAFCAAVAAGKLHKKMPASAIQIAKIVVDFILSLPRNWEKSIVVDTEELASRIREWPGPELASCVGASLL